jgi:hypothetical protein
MYFFKKGINSLVSTVVNPVAMIFKGSVTASPVRFRPKSIASMRDKEEGF